MLNKHLKKISKYYFSEREQKFGFKVLKMTRHLADFEDYTDLEEDDIDFDVVIVGGGLSGLTAGNRLISAGLNVVILEQTGMNSKIRLCKSLYLTYSYKSRNIFCLK